MVQDDHRSPHLPRPMLEEYKRLILQEQGRVLEDGEAEMEALNLIQGIALLIELKVKHVQQKRDLER